MENPVKNDRFYLNVLQTLLLVTLLGCGPSKEEKEKMFFDSGYIIGNVITDSVSNRIVSSLQEMDKELTYQVSNTKKIITELKTKVKYPMIETVITTESKMLENPKISYQVKLTLDELTGDIIGTLRKLNINGETNSIIKSFNDKMYVMMVDDSDIKQVVLSQKQYVFSEEEVDLGNIFKQNFKKTVEEYERKKKIRQRRNSEVLLKENVIRCLTSEVWVQVIQPFVYHWNFYSDGSGSLTVLRSSGRSKGDNTGSLRWRYLGGNRVRVTPLISGWNNVTVEVNVDYCDVEIY